MYYKPNTGKDVNVNIAIHIPHMKANPTTGNLFFSNETSENKAKTGLSDYSGFDDKIEISHAARKAAMKKKEEKKGSR